MRAKFSALITFLTLVASPAFAACACGDDRRCGDNCSCEEISTATAETTYTLQGVVKSIMADRGMLLIKHEAIPGYMRPMTMAFRVDDETLKAAQKGHSISGQLVKQDGKFWLIEVKYTPTETK